MIYFTQFLFAFYTIEVDGFTFRSGLPPHGIRQPAVSVTTRKGSWVKFVNVSRFRRDTVKYASRETDE